MALYIYDVADPQAAFSNDGDFTNPFSLTFNGTDGGIIKRKVYIRNDDVSQTHTGITVTPVDNGHDIVDGSSGFSWKLSAGDTELLEEQWADIVAGEAISIPNISDTTTYQPFWIRVEVPARSSVNSFQSVQLRIDSTAT